MGHLVTALGDKVGCAAPYPTVCFPSATASPCTCRLPRAPSRSEGFFNTSMWAELKVNGQMHPSSKPVSPSAELALTITTIFQRPGCFADKTRISSSKEFRARTNSEPQWPRYPKPYLRRESKKNPQNKTSKTHKNTLPFLKLCSSFWATPSNISLPVSSVDPAPRELFHTGWRSRQWRNSSLSRKAP